MGELLRIFLMGSLLVGGPFVLGMVCHAWIERTT